ncbi:hypothetical protein BDW22DRAFT_1045733 [Trametopsis cervina]|nr:hypothetical protein BDW22DRAFT_1045733 [Trametopsis cervina]
MTCTEIWLTYHQTSRVSRPSTAQLIDLGAHGGKLTDLEDVLDYIFAEGFVESKYRPVTYWEKSNGEKVKGSLAVEELVLQGVGKCEETALRLIIADIPPAVWFSYHYTSSAAGTALVKQRVKVEALHTAACTVHPKVAHLTNHIFQQGYLAKHLRSRVHWETIGGKRIEEHGDLLELLAVGEGVAEDKTLRLMIDDYFHVHHEHHREHHHDRYVHCSF